MTFSANTEHRKGSCCGDDLCAQAVLSRWGVDIRAMRLLLDGSKSDSKKESARASLLLTEALLQQGVPPALVVGVSEWDADELERVLLLGLERTEKKRLLEEAKVIDMLVTLLPAGNTDDFLAGIRALR
eukprot:CAMPEP_0173390094 /NCGR_PEP_ID=MMETSP1356-20130122/14296_1 /TAXON_ID=77927 ORGANISM="Hemiselmis virescens, Strain PCC157" /NCGR_SAMPLE_ID=MMETSP1356 /ASSEMBLY_ACC=CAM_ASM_000847 /LENGTH=128 /DNA_ID=CAMNT_0014347415 /DNA_START=213 /DNA_END=596 /DNA_ORIENTATION=+